MKKSFLFGMFASAFVLLSFALALPQQALATDGWWTKAVIDGENHWTAVSSSANGTKLIAADSSRNLYVSSDSGLTWRKISEVGEHKWTAVNSSADGTKLFAAYSDCQNNCNYNEGYIYISTNGGLTWTQSSGAGLHNWVSIDSSSDGSKLVATEQDRNYDSYIYTSTNGGISWTRRIQRGGWGMAASSADGTKLAVVSNYIHVSSDGGENWVALTEGPNDSNGIFFSADGTKLFVAGESGLHISMDGGANWTTNTSLTGLKNITSSDDGQILAVTTNANLYTSSDGGSNWVLQSAISDQDFFTSITSSSDGSKILASVTNYDGGLYIYGNLKPTPTIDSVSASSDVVYLAAITNNDSSVRGFEYGLTTNYGSATTESGEFGPGDFSVELTSLAENTKYHYRAYATNQAGTGYSADSSFIIKPLVAQPNSGQRNWSSIVSSSDGQKMLASDNLGVYTSTDGGVNWTPRIIDADLNPLTSSFKVASSANGTKLAVATSWSVYPTWDFGGDIYTSNDSGLTWVKQNNSAKFWRAIASSVDGTKLIAAGSLGMVNTDTTKIYISTDSGVTWSESFSISEQIIDVTSSSDAKKLAFITSTGSAYTSSNGGLSWTERSIASLQTWQKLASSLDAKRLAAISTENIYTSSDSGVTWVKRTIPGLGDGYWKSITSSGNGFNLTILDSNNNIYNSVDAGINWTKQIGAGKDHFSSVNMSLDTTKLSVLSNSNYLYTYLSPDSSSVPYVSINDAELITGDSAILKAEIINSNGDIIARGFDYGLTTNYEGTISEAGLFDTGLFSSELTSLNCGTTYHYRAFAENSEGTGYSDDQTFTTSACPLSIVTNSATNINKNSVTLNGTVGSTGGLDVLARGFEYGLTTNYTATTTETGIFGAESFSSELTLLTCNTTYHYRAYASTADGDNYGEDNTFVTSACPVSGGSSSAGPAPIIAVGSGKTNFSVPMGETLNIGSLSNSGTNILAYINSQANFTASESSNNNQLAAHSFKISNLNLVNNTITIIVASEPQTLTLQKGETKSVDLDGDGINDIVITFANISVNCAEVTVKSLDNKNLPVKTESPTTAPDSVNDSNSVITAEQKLTTKINPSLIKKLAGRILLQVETKGQAWYLDKVSLKRYYLADGPSAYQALRKFGLGITNNDLAKIPVASTSALPSDYIKSSKYSTTLTNKLKGRIVLQVENHGEAWYINPVDGLRYYLANGEAAYQIMRNLSLGITNSNIHTITVGNW